MLKSIQLWDGKSWIPFKNRSSIIASSHLRLVLESEDDIRQIAMHQKFESQVELRRKSMPNFAASYEQADLAERQMIFDQNSFKQTRQGRYVFVDLDIDHQTLTEYIWEIPWVYRGATPEGALPPPESDIQTHKGLEERSLFGHIDFVTESGLTNQSVLKNNVTFKKVTAESWPDQRPRLQTKKTYTPNQSGRQCKGLF